VRTNLLAKHLKTLGLHKNGTLYSQIESREYEGWCRDVKWPQSDTGVSFCNRNSGIVRMRDALEAVGPGIFGVWREELRQDLRTDSSSLREITKVMQGKNFWYPLMWYLHEYRTTATR
jgi:hypothetical protein